MEVAYTTTLEDFVAYNLYLYRKAQLVRKPFIVVLSGLFAFVGILGLIAAKNWAWRAYAVVALLFAFYPLIHPYWLAHQIRALVKKRGVEGLLGPTRLILTEESLMEITEAGKTERWWHNMSGIEEVGDRTFISITGLSAVILPKHGFEREEDYQRARDFALSRFKDRDTQFTVS
ncbi:MAG: YcxB family protein [Planctomycetaceae bacterium]|nr:YcxB family protein [Planctomycetaceae bacterium]